MYFFNICSDISLNPNEEWTESDQEFTGSRSIIQAVWPTLHHGHYLWKLVKVENLHRPPQDYNQYHCNRPNVLACGKTEVGRPSVMTLLHICRL